MQKPWGYGTSGRFGRGERQGVGKVETEAGKREFQETKKDDVYVV